MLTYNNLIYENIENNQIQLIDFNKQSIDLKLRHKLIELISYFQDEEKKYIPKELNNFTRQIPGEIINSWINNSNLLYILYDGPKEIGFCSIILDHFKFPKNVAHISYLYVVPDKRGSNLGSSLLKFAIDKTQELYPNKKNFTLNCLTANAPANNLYKKLGFKEFTGTFIR